MPSVDNGSRALRTGPEQETVQVKTAHPQGAAWVSAPSQKHIFLLSPSWPKAPPEAPAAGPQRPASPGPSGGGGPAPLPGLSSCPLQTADSGKPALPSSCGDESGHRPQRGGRRGVSRRGQARLTAGTEGAPPSVEGISPAASRRGGRRPLCFQETPPWRKPCFPLWEKRALQTSLQAPGPDPLLLWARPQREMGMLVLGTGTWATSRKQ